MNTNYQNLLKMQEHIEEVLNLTYGEIIEIEEMIEVDGEFEIMINQKRFQFTKDFFIKLLNVYMEVNEDSLCSHGTDDTKVFISQYDGLQTFEIFSRGGSSVYSLNEDGFLSEYGFFKILNEVLKNLDNKIMEKTMKEKVMHNCELYSVVVYEYINDSTGYSDIEEFKEMIEEDGFYEISQEIDEMVDDLRPYRSIADSVSGHFHHLFMTRTKY